MILIGCLPKLWPKSWAQDRFHDQTCIWTFSTSVVNIFLITQHRTHVFVLSVKINDSKYRFILRTFHLRCFYLVFADFVLEKVVWATDTFPFHLTPPSCYGKYINKISRKFFRWSPKMLENRLNFTSKTDFQQKYWEKTVKTQK